MEKVAIIDIETTGLYPNSSLILEIGIVELDLNSGKTKILFDSLVNEPGFGENHRSSWIFENSDMVFEEVLKAPELSEFENELQTIFNKYGVSAYNKAFDLGFLTDRGFFFPNELPCIMITSTSVCRIPFRRPLDMERYSGREYKWPSVQEAWNFFFPHSNYIEGHRAADDALHEAKIFYELYRFGYLLL